MLVLQRYSGQSIKIGDEVVVTILGNHQGSTRIGIEAPRGINIVREELLDRPIKTKQRLESKDCGKNEQSIRIQGPDSAII